VRDQPSAVSRYTQSPSTVNRVYDSKARHYAEHNKKNRIVRTGRPKAEAEVTNN